MDIDSAIVRYLRNPDVARWLFCRDEFKTVSSQALNASFVYAIGFGAYKPGTPRSMNIEDMLIVTGRAGSFVLGVVWGLAQPHIFARTPLMLDKKPVARRFAVDFSARDALEFMEFVLFEDGKVIVMFRQFLHTLDLSLPVVACARLHNTSQVHHTLGPILMRADVFEAASCPACGFVGRECQCSFAAYAPSAPVRKTTYTWNQYTGCFMQKAREGTVKISMTAMLPNVGEMAIMNDDLPVLNVLQCGDTEYMTLMRRKAVHGLGINVIMPRTDQIILAMSVENDFLDLHNSYVTRKRLRADESNDPASILMPALAYPVTDQLAPTIARPEALDFPPVVNFFDSQQPSNSESIESVEDVLSIFPSTSTTAESPHYPTGTGNKLNSAVPDAGKPRDVMDFMEKSVPQEAADILLMDPQSTSPSLGYSFQEEAREHHDIVNSLELILSPTQSNSEMNEATTYSQPESVQGLVLKLPGRNEERMSSSVSSRNAFECIVEEPDTQVENVKASSAKRKKVSKRAKSRPPLLDSSTDGEKKHACTKCTSRFKMRGDLLRHVKIVHEGKKMYTCETCGKAFGHSGHLNRHVSSVHLQQRRFKCKLCGFLFFQHSHLQSHIGHIHVANKLHACKECGFRAPHQMALNAHMNKEHNPPPEQGPLACPVRDCTQKFATDGQQDVPTYAQHQQVPPENVLGVKIDALGV